MKVQVGSRSGEPTDWGTRTVSRTCSMALQAMKFVKVTLALISALDVMVKGFVLTWAGTGPITSCQTAMAK